MIAVVWFFYKTPWVKTLKILTLIITKRGLGKFLPAKLIYYSEIQNIVLKRFGYQEEDGNLSNQGYFHLRLNNGKTRLVMVFNHADSIEDARKNIAKHSKLKNLIYLKLRSFTNKVILSTSHRHN